MIRPDDNILDFVDDYVHGLLSPEDEQLVERYCERSALGRAALEEARKRYAALQAIAPSEASEKLIQQTLGRLEMAERQRTLVVRNLGRMIALAAAASVLVLGALNVYFVRLKPSPYDLRVLGQAELLSGSRGSLRLLLWHRDQDRPLSGVPVTIALYNPLTRKELQLATLPTDERGTVAPRFALPEWPEGRYELRVTALPGGSPETLSRSIRLTRQWTVMVSTDKPVYQPGQTIHMRSLALRKPDLRPVAAQEAIFTVTDPKGNVIFKHRDLTSRFGIASTDCPLAAEILQGQYQIQCTVGETTSKRSVTVEKYVLPKFRVSLELDKPFYAPGDQVSGSVQADYFFGQPVAGGKAAIEAHGVDVSQRTFVRLERDTDEHGKATFTFSLPEHWVGREQEGGDARFVLAVTVTDTAGQKASGSASRMVTASPIKLEVIPESGTLVRDVDNTIFVFTSYPDGRPARTRVLGQGHGEELQTSELGIASFQLKPIAEEVPLLFKAIDADGRTAQRSVRLRCGATHGDFLLRPDKAVYRGGETVNLVALGGGNEPVFVDILHEGQTILAEQLELRGGRGEYAFDLPPDVSGTLQICAYRFGPHGLAVRKSQTIVVKQARELTIRATLDQPEYRPGSEATVKLKLNGPDGESVPGAISVQAVDEAVFSVLAQRSSSEQTFFLLEQELLKPVYAVYPGWSPRLFTELPGLDRVQFERALFSHTAQHAEGAGALPQSFVTGRENLRGGAGIQQPSPFSLAANSYSDKLHELSAKRKAALARLAVAWFSLIGIMTLGGVIALGVFYPRALVTALIVVLAGIGGLLGMLIVILWLLLLGSVLVGCGAAAPEKASTAAPSPAAADMPLASAPGALPEKAAPPRVREWFPETLLWRPELITDDNGEATLEFTLADSITTWRLTTSAVSAEGQLGGADFPIRVFQPFFVDVDLPVSLTRNDEVGVPIVVYNYLDRPQRVALTVKQSDWFERLPEDSSNDAAEAHATTEDHHLQLDLGPGEVRSITFRLRAVRVGTHQLEVAAVASEVADAVRREIEVVADGVPVEQVTSGTFAAPIEKRLEVPDGAIEGSARAVVKLYPSNFSQLVEGLDAIFQMPYGCFEQTSSTTYPNVLALDYLRKTGKSVPEVEAKARQYIHLGYQRLVSFEVAGGGFDWFGRPPANRTLTAYGLMEFEDMARVHDVDPRLIERTRQWLLAQRRPDGTWPSEANMLNDGLAGSVQRGGDLELATTAYLAWAVFGNGQSTADATPTLQFLAAHSPRSIDDPYLLAITANAIAAIDKEHSRLDEYLGRLHELKRSSADGKLAWWEQTPGTRTHFYGAGQAGHIETTAMATLALLQAGQHPDTVRAALSWLVGQKDSRGTWHSTQATVLALKALVAGTGAVLESGRERQIEVTLDDETIARLTLPPEQSEVMRQVELSEHLKTGRPHRLRLVEKSGIGVNYQLTFRYHIASRGNGRVAADQPLSVDIRYDRQRLSVSDLVTAIASVRNNSGRAAPMVILDLPVPGGFAVNAADFEELVESRKIARYQVTARKVIVYLRQLEADESLELPYRLRATMPVNVQVPAAEAYEYYDPARRGEGGATRLEAVSSA